MKVFKRTVQEKDKKKLDFIRWDWTWISIGFFLRYGNYCKGKGVEMFTLTSKRTPRILQPFLGWHIGWTKEWQSKLKIFRWKWSGSASEPWTSWTLRIGRFGIGNSTPILVQKWARKRAQKRYERGMEYWESPDDLQPVSPERLGPEGF
jgi:hypothetical protein